MYLIVGEEFFLFHLTSVSWVTHVIPSNDIAFVRIMNQIFRQKEPEV